MRMGRRAEARFVQLKESHETKDYCARNRPCNQRLAAGNQ